MSDYGSTPPPTSPPPPPPGGGGTPPSQPPGGGGNPPPPSYGAYGSPGSQGTPPPNYLVWAILTTIFCCLPLGIVSIVYSTQVNSKWATGDVIGAQEASAKARTFAIWTAVAGAVWVVGWLIFVLALGGLSTSFNTGTNNGF
jgi:hypothetical protein